MTCVVALMSTIVVLFAGCAQTGMPDIQPPQAAQFGASVEELRPTFDNACDSYTVREMNVADLGEGP